MRRKHLIKGSAVVGVFCAGLFAGVLLSGQDDASAQREALVLATPTLLGQEWSAEQKEVWAAVEEHWGFAVLKDAKGIMGTVHPDYCGWWASEPLPVDFAGAEKWNTHWIETNQAMITEVKPVAIQIREDVACVHYYFKQAYKDAEGKDRLERGRWTDIWVKEGDRWLILWDHGGQTSLE